MTIENRIRVPASEALEDWQQWWLAPTQWLPSFQGEAWRARFSDLDSLWTRLAPFAGHLTRAYYTALCRKLRIPALPEAPDAEAQRLVDAWMRLPPAQCAHASQLALVLAGLIDLEGVASLEDQRWAAAARPACQAGLTASLPKLANPIAWIWPAAASRSPYLAPPGDSSPPIREQPQGDTAARSPLSHETLLARRILRTVLQRCRASMTSRPGGGLA